MIDPTEDDIGRAVVYRSTYTKRKGLAGERGVITSIGPSFVFVRYGDETGSKGTARNDLEWADPWRAEVLTALADRMEGIRKPTDRYLRDLDAELMRTLFPEDKHHLTVVHVGSGGLINGLTESVDAALALLERLIPGVFYVAGRGKVSSREPLYGCTLFFNFIDELGAGEHDLFPLAIIIATLRALVSLKVDPPKNMEIN